MTAPARERAAVARRRRRGDTKTNVKISASGARFGLFCWTFLNQTKGPWARQPLGLELFQIEVMSELLRVERERWLTLTVRDVEQLGGLHDDRAAFWERIRAWRLEQATSGLRVYREGLLEIPKKNGKSTKGSGLALFLLVGDEEEGAEVYSAASAKDQAKIVLRQAREMVESSPKLLERVRLYRDAIEYPALNAFYRVLAHDAGTTEGVNPSGVIPDEIHAHPNRLLYDTLRSATIAREQPLIFAITTAGVTLRDRDGELTLLGSLRQRGAGPKPKYTTLRLGDQRFSIVKPRPDKQRSFYFRAYEVPWAHRENKTWWKMANPAPWITAAKLQEESDVERPRGIFYRYHLDITTRVELHWLKPGAWDRCKGTTRIEPPDPIVITVDVGLSYDTTAVVVTKPIGPPGPDQRFEMRAEVWGVHDDPARPPPPAHHLEPEGPIRLATIKARILEIARQGYRVLAIGGDPHKFETELQELEDAGFLVVRFDQGNATMTPASEALYRIVGAAHLTVDDDPIYEAHMENATARDVGGGKWRLDKRRATDKMDAAVASAMGVALAQNPDVVHARRPSFEVIA